MAQCPDCMGTGESFPMVTCRRCMGSGDVKRFSALVTCTTECEVIVYADDACSARQKMNAGQFDGVRLWDGGLPMEERFDDVVITDESFGEDGED